MKIGLICNKKRDEKTLEAKKFARNIEIWLKKRGHETFWELSAKISKNLDLAIIFGGDGLVLYAADKLAPYKVPLFRVNFGHRGFLANIEPEEVFNNLDRIFKNDFHIEERNRIMAEIFNNGKLKEKMDALNEIAVGGISRTVSLRLEVRQKEKNFFLETHSDGLLVSTRTGSTAYNINAGGAMLLVENIFSVAANNGFFSSEIIKMPIKSFIAADNCEFKIEIINQNKLNLPHAVADGQRVYKLKKGDYIVIKKSLEKNLFLEIGRDKI